MTKVVFKLLDTEFLRIHVKEFIEMCQRNMNDEYWDESNFLTELKGKWQYSFYVTDSSLTIQAFIIASEKDQSVHIHKFVVDKPFQSEGLGSKMLDHILQQSSKPITLKVRNDNERAIAFYKQKGFVADGIQNDMYKMIRPLAI